MAYSKYSIIISVFFPWNSTANNYIPYVRDNLCEISSERESESSLFFSAFTVQI